MGGGARPRDLWTAGLAGEGLRLRVDLWVAGGWTAVEAGDELYSAGVQPIIWWRLGMEAPRCGWRDA